MVLTIAGSDSGGGAGIQADLRTFAAFGIHGLCVITAVTAQNTREVAAIDVLRSAIVKAQLDAVFADFRFDVVKLGMLASPAIVRLVASTLERHSRIKVVLDPVLVASTGAPLGHGALAAALRRHLLPRADLLTPNWPEASHLLGREFGPQDGPAEAAEGLLALGARAVLLKGGHLPGSRVRDLLVSARDRHWFTHPRIAVEGHGTGCTLASAVAAGLALGLDLDAAVTRAIAYVQRALRAGYRPGKGTLRVLDHATRA
ncbi:MAG TPA: bifunctional hydroxymethylpyrimidine kinase/phosphomethylpyrimidine kinase [Rhodanobacteraceae bacterium]|nr:bifunctional hydroxymethylpyrimidine kinase/phosphomethylpyrimidine kinase [Rhodanobacteraceae bacterium]